FSIHNIGALYCSGFAEGFSNSKRQAAACALLRHDTHLDGTHYHTRRPNGLHPSYAAFNSSVKTKEHSISRNEFVEASLQDLFDSITIQDRLDGSISLLLCCLGFKAETALSPENITVDLYVTPQEACKSSEQIGGDIVVLTQAFSENHQQRVAKIRGQIRSEINVALLTGNPKATMQWTHFFRNIVKCYSVVIEGWPEQIPFVNLSTASSSLTDLE
ncbi:hypothetical protein EDB19DRAFT_1597968, partial [Suillus lakei]